MASERLEHLDNDRHMLRDRQHTTQVACQRALCEAGAGSPRLLPPTTAQGITGGSLELVRRQDTDPRNHSHGSLGGLYRCRFSCG